VAPRVLDHLLAGPLPLQPSAPCKNHADITLGRLSDGRALLDAQFRVFRKKAPIALTIVFLRTLVGLVGFGFPEQTHWILRISVPVALLVAVVLRIRHWIRLQHTELAPEEILKLFKRARIQAALLSIGYGAWSVLLFEQADLNRRAYITVFVVMSAMSCAYCLASLPSIAALTLMLAAGPIIARLFVSFDPLLSVPAINFSLILILALRMLSSHFDRFVDIIASRAQILAERERALAAEVDAIAQRGKAEQTASTDALTNLPNRRALLMRLDALISERLKGGSFAVAMLDLDRFKLLNDSFGHRTGDRILREVGARLSKVAGPDATVARLGGDEFSIVLPCAASRFSVEQKAREFCETLSVPFELGQTSVRLSGSCGLALFPDAGNEAEELIARADTALYHVKRTGSGGVATFCYEMESHIRRRARIEQVLGLASIQNEVSLAYQPIIDLRTSRLRSFEALARWTDIELGAVPPVEFISVAEQAGFIDQLSDKLFDKALTQANTWPQHIGLSFNLSAVQLCSASTPLKLIASMAKRKFDPHRLQVEVTETALLMDYRTARETIRNLRNVGVRIALDDFGAGYSSIEYLREMVFDFVKIDGSLVQPIVDSTESRSLLKGVVNLCSAIGIPCIAERVETDAHIRLLEELQCEYGQGFAFSKPMPGNLALRMCLSSRGILSCGSSI